mgnify:CR=1 FL=1
MLHRILSQTSCAPFWPTGLQHWDEQLLKWINHHGSSFADDFWFLVSEKWIWIPLYALLAYAIFRHFGIRKLLWSLLFIGLTITATDQISSGLFKPLTQRKRPCHNECLNFKVYRIKNKCGGTYGFFSSHSSNSMALAVFVGLLFWQRWRWLLPAMVGWSLLQCYSRIYLGKHYPTDVLAGILCGMLAGALFYELFRRLEEKKPGIFSRKS